MRPAFLARVPQALPISSISNSLFRWKKHCSKHASPATITSAKAMTPAIDEPQLERDPHLPLHYFDRRRSRLQRSGSHKTRRWRKADSNFRSPWRLGRSAPRKSRGNSSAVRVGTARDTVSLQPGSEASKPMPEAEIAKAVQLLDLMLEFFADDGHWTRGS